MSELESHFENFGDLPIKQEEENDLLSDGRNYEEVKSEMTNVNDKDSFTREYPDAKNINCEEENTIDSIKCSFCKKSIARANIRDHTKAHMQLSCHICPHCGKSFPDTTKLKGHIRTHTGEKPFQCDKCDKTFAIKGGLTSHNRAVHLKENFFQCDQCEYSCTSKRGLLGHENRIHKSEVFKCDICKSILVSEEGFKEHKNSMRCTENICDHCGKGFASKVNLEQHLNTHRNQTEKVYNFNCDKCGKCFTSKQSLTEHDRIHENIKPCTCDICGKPFRKQGGLRAHRKAVHSVL